MKAIEVLKDVGKGFLLGVLVGAGLFLAFIATYYPYLFVSPLSTVLGHLLGIMMNFVLLLSTIAGVSVLVYTFLLGFKRINLSLPYSAVVKGLWALILLTDVVFLFLLAFYIPTANKISNFEIIKSRLINPTNGNVVAILSIIISLLLGLSLIEFRAKSVVVSKITEEAAYAESSLFVLNLALLLYAMWATLGITDVNMYTNTMTGLLFVSLMYFAFVGVASPVAIKAMSKLSERLDNNN